MSNSNPKILVVGSTNMDFVIHIDRPPDWGETILGKYFFTNPGGKGANQAVASAKLGANTFFISCLGDDFFGDQLFSELTKYHVNTSCIKRQIGCSSGIASIYINSNGENQIIVIPGSNLLLTPTDIRDRQSLIETVDIILVQLEIPLDTVLETMQLANKYHIPVILNPAPACELPKTFFYYVNYLTPNESESSLLTGVSVTDIESANKAGNRLIELGVQNVIITMGDKGALFVSDTESQHIPSFTVNAIDTTAAGDAFNGGFAYAIASGMPVIEAIKFANCVGALSVTREGAQQSMPNLNEVLNLLNKSSLQVKSI